MYFWLHEYVNSRYLPLSGKEFQTIVMRLPQSSNQSLSALFVNVSLFLTLVLAIVSPMNARQSTNQLVCSPATARFGAIVVGRSVSQEIVLTNTGDASATVSAISVSNSEFSVSGISLPATLSAGQSVALSVDFSPNSIGETSAELTITSNAENPTLQVVIKGAGVQSEVLTASPASLSFGEVPVGSSVTRSVVVANPHSSDQTITSLHMLGTGFSISSSNMPVTISPGQTVTLSVSFAPQAAGADAGSIFAFGGALNIPLSGTGTAIGQLSIAPGTLSFGNVDVGTSTSQPSSMTASGGSVTISSASSSNSQFSISGVSLPVTINAGQTVSFDVVFAPAKTGADSATLSFASNSSSQSSESLSGTGILTQYSINLSWNASSSPVSGYNVYRGTTVGTYSKINSALDANTSYTDSTVASGVTYYYAATSVNSSGQESGYSTPVEVSVP
jgi:hypothetical protein